MTKANFTLKRAWQCCFGLLLMLAVPISGSAQSFSAADTPQNFVDNAAISSVANASFGTGDVIGTDISIDVVSLTLNHTWVSDLEIVLVSPNGTRLALGTDNGGNDFEGPYTLSYTDASANEAGDWDDGLAPEADYRAEGGDNVFPVLDAGVLVGIDGPGADMNTVFAGEAATGNWTLEVFDDAAGDTGTLSDFTIAFSAVQSTQTDITFCVDLTCQANTPGFAAQGIGFGPGFNPNNFLTDMGNNIFCGTYPLEAGEVRFNFAYNGAVGAGGPEDLSGLNGSACTSTVDGIVKRSYTVVQGMAETITFAFESCDEVAVCAPPTTITTICGDFTCETGYEVQRMVIDGMGVVNLNTNTSGDIWCADLELAEGDEIRYFFQYSIPLAAPAEDLSGLEAEACVENGRRIYTATDMAVTLTYAWESCEASPTCEPADVPVTICGNFACETGYEAPRMVVDGMGVVNLTDNAGGDTWCATLSMAEGDEIRYFFQYSIPLAAPAEDLSGLEAEACVENGRRVYTVTAVAETVTYAWESCESMEVCAPEGANVEFCVDVTCWPSPVETVNVFGNNFPNGFFNPTGDELSDDDGDGIYCGTVFLPVGDTEYKFLVNGTAEVFEPGGTCTTTFVAGGGQTFTNRLITVEDGVDQMVTFGMDSCDEVCSPRSNIEFCVDIGCIMPSGPVNVFGSFEPFGNFLFFNASATPLMDDDGDDIYCGTVALRPGDLEFKFLLQANGITVEESFTAGDPCTTTPFGFTNRIITVGEDMDETQNYVFNQPCEGTFEEPTVEFPELTPVCDAEFSFTVTGGATPEGGVYSGENITDNGDGTFDVDLAAAAAGDITVTYTFEGELDCVYTGEATLTIEDCGLAVTDPCECNGDNSPVLYDPATGYTNPNDGTFSETVAVTGPMGAALPDGLDFRVVAVENAIGVAVGDVLTFDANMNYSIAFNHPDDIGYSLTVDQFINGQALGLNLMISNLCAYPNPIFDPALDAIYCSFETVVALGADVSSGFAGSDDVSFTINGEDADEFDPAALGAGEYEVVMTFDGAEDGNGGVSPDGGTTAAFPGCTQVVIANVVLTDLNLGCIGDINVTLGADCEATITPSMVLSGDFSCADDFFVNIDDTGDNKIIGCGDHTYEIDVIVAGEVVYSCWGNLFAEDKTAPEVDCPADATSVDVVVETYPINGELTATDPTLAISNWSCFQDFFSPLAGDHPYDVLEFTVGATDFYTFDVDSDFGDAAMTMYQGGFDVDNPCQNIIGTNGDDFATQGTPFDPRLRFSLPLIAGETYQIVVTNWAPGDLGEYVVNIFADNNGSISGINAVATTQTFDLFCDDVDYIRFTTPQSWVVNADGTIDEDTSIDEFFGGDDDAFEDFVEKLSRAGLPTATDNCGQILITVVDGGTTGNGDCGDIQMTRTFTIQDRYDNCTDSNGEPSGEDCTQVITFRRPTLGDVEIPPFLVVVECDEEYPTDGATGGPDENVSAALAGYPFIRTAAGFQDLNQNYCNIGASYSDEPRVVVCEGTFNYRREWNIIDWCNPGGSGTLDQFIKVGDFTGPAIDAPALVEFSTSPFGCEANINVPTLPVSDVGGCSSAFPTSYTVFANGETLFATGTYVLQGGVYVASPAVVAAPIGEHTIEFCAEDACGNETCVIVDVTVEDNIEPSAACDDELNVSIGGGDVANDIEGQARIFAIDVNEGSNDNCGEVTLEVRRNFWRNDDCDPSASRWSPWGDFVDFYCCDIGNEITIELRVTDEAGNENVCWMVVTPEDKINPFCYAPDPMTITCSDLPFSFPGDIATAYEEDFDGTSEMMDGLFGGASGTDNCAVDAVVERQPSININECGWGSITRRFEVWQARPEGDVNGNGELDANEAFRSTNSCSQLITITEVHDFTIDFPEDADADCGAPDVPTIITDAVGCDVLAVNIGEPVRFAATGDECYKMSITYDVINWCLWDGEYTGYVLPRMTEDDGEGLAVDRAVEGNERPVITYTDAQGLCIDRRHADRDGDSSLSNCDSPTLENYGRYIYTQFIKVYDTTVPVVTVDPYGGPTAQCPDLEEGQFGDYFGTCDAPVSFTFSVTDDCELFNMAGDLVISIASAELDAFAVDASGDGEIVSSEFEADLDVLSNITDNGDGTYVFAGTFPVITSAMGENIIHAVRILFEDGCGNQTSIYVEFDVVDCKGPAPICINGLTVTLMPQQEGGCAMAIWASDFEASPISDCTGQGPEEFLGNPRVTKYAIYRASTVEADPDFVPNPADTGLVLTDEDDETTVVYVYAFDEEGNYDYCETYVLVQLNDLCLSNGNGSISGVIATEEGDTVEGAEVNLSGAMVTSLTTNGDGSFSFENLTVGGDYSVAPYLNSGFLNGVSTFDLVLMSKHILGVQPLNSAYKMIAADINNSRTVTTLDMIQLRKLILNIDTEFANNTSWRFVAASHNFSDISNPWLTEFPEVESFNNITVDALVADFVGVKIGDVNGSAAANAQSGDDRTLNGQFNLDVEDINMKAGNTYTVAVTAAEVEGFQGTLALKGADLVNIEYAAATAENFGLRFATEGMITMSYNGKSSGELFNLVIRATQDAQLSEVLSVNSRYTVAEAYEGNNTMDLGINFSGLTVEAGFEVYQNTPNPFQAETLIGFNLPVDAEVTVTISDVSGRVLNVIRTDAAAGYNTINVTKDMVQGATGVLTYTVTSGEFTATKTMVAVK